MLRSGRVHRPSAMIDRRVDRTGRRVAHPPAVRLLLSGRWLLGCSTLLSLAACGGDDFTELFTTEHFVYYVEDGAEPPCDATAEWLERYYSANASFLGATLPPGERIEYYLARSPETLGCSSPHATACTVGMMGFASTIRAQAPVHAHELVHANAFLLGEPPVLFQEGLAEILSCSSGTDGGVTIDTSDPIEALVESDAFVSWLDANDIAAYPESASFVRYLIDNFGQSRFLSFYARAPHWGSRADIDEVFRDEIGIGLDGAFADWRTRPPPHYSDLCLRLMECDPSTPPLVDDTDVALGCGPGGNSGPWANAEAIRRFSVPEARIIHITTETTESSPTDRKTFPTVSYYRCSGGDVIGGAASTASYPIGVDHFVQPSFALDVPPGEYVAWFNADPETRVHLGVDERRSPMRDPACQPAEEPLLLDDDHQTLLTSRWSEWPCNGPWCPGKGWDVSIGGKGGALEAQALPFGGPEYSPGELYICSEPCPQDASSCEIVPLDVVDKRPIRSKQTFAPGTVLHLGAPAAPDAGHFVVLLSVVPE